MAATDEYTVQMKGANGPVTLYVSRSAVRRVEPGFKVDVIYRLSDGKIIYMDDEQKTYSEVTLAEARQHGRQGMLATARPDDAHLHEYCTYWSRSGPTET